MALAVLPAAVIAIILWIVTVPLLSAAGAASLAVATLVAGTSVGRRLFDRRDPWRVNVISAAIQFAILWPLAWLMISYSARHP